MPTLFREWWVAGPFPEDWSFSSPLETDQFDPNAKFEGLDGQEVGWELAPAYWKREPEQIKDFRDFFERRGKQVQHCSAHATLEVMATEDSWLEILLRWDDAIKVWVNGEEVFADPHYRWLGAGEERMEVPLQKGRNQILVRVLQAEEVWAFAAILTPISQPAWISEADYIADLLRRRGYILRRFAAPRRRPAPVVRPVAPPDQAIGSAEDAAAGLIAGLSSGGGQ